MNEREDELFELELLRLKPAEPPADFLARLTAARPMAHSLPTIGQITAPPDRWQLLLRWLAPAAVAAVIVAAWFAGQPGPVSPATSLQAASPSGTNQVEIDRQLVSTFDAVAELPGGEPVRFRCREWVDDVTVRNTKQGVEVEQREPRLEVVPIRFETY